MEPIEGMSSCRPDDPVSLRRSVMMKYMRIIKLHRNVLETGVKQTGVYRSQHQILMLLSEHKDVSQKELAQRMFVSTATIAVSVKKLEKAGYITRIADQEDNRMNKLCLTEKGRHMVKNGKEYFYRVEKQMFKNFSKEELSVMEQQLNRMFQNLSEITMSGDTTESED